MFTVTSYFHPVWTAFSKHTDGSLQWIPKQIVAIGEDFHSQVGDGKVRTTLSNVRWEGYDKKDDVRRHLGVHHASRICYHDKIVQGITCERSWETGPYLTSVDSRHVSDGDRGILPVYPTHQTNGSVPRWCSGHVRHVTCTVPKCGFVIRYQNTSNLEQHYIRVGLDHKELVYRLTAILIITNTGNTSSLMMTHTGNSSSPQCQEVGRRKGTKELVVIWTYSVALVWLVWFVSKRFVNEIIMIIIKHLKKFDYQRAW